MQPWAGGCWVVRQRDATTIKQTAQPRPAFPAATHVVNNYAPARGCKCTAIAQQPPTVVINACIQPLLLCASP